MLIVLSQRIDIKSDYDDVPFSSYHFPKQYRNLIHSGDRFIYYQGDRWKKEHRYYFGCGVIGKVYSAANNTFYADIVDGETFAQKVPIYHPEGDFYESLDYSSVRKKPNPPWQSSIRPLSETAFSTILAAAKVGTSSLQVISQIETSSNAIDTLRTLNILYAGLKPEVRAKRLASHLDRGDSVTRALKQLLGSKCQICGWNGFRKRDDTEFIEAHHLVQISERHVDSLCTENIILVCPNCHREIHYGEDIEIRDDGNLNFVRLSNKIVRIPKNTIQLLESKVILH
ncbi:MAG: HNH endonuclease [Dehalococcoidales bacterium]|nr:HNH endonuclease [Dehalococcoidales bacterium]